MTASNHTQAWLSAGSTGDVFVYSIIRASSGDFKCFNTGSFHEIHSMKKRKNSGFFCLILLLEISIASLACGGGDDDSSNLPPNRIGKSINYVSNMPGIKVDTKKVREIIYPLFTVPAIIKKGENLSVKVDTGGLVPSNWSVTLTSIDGSPVTFSRTLNVIGISSGSSYWRTSSTIYEVLVDIPADILSALYDITVSYNTSSGMISDTQPHSVCVVDEYNKDFSFVHLTDMHVGSPRNNLDSTEVNEAGFWSPDKFRRWLYIQKTIREVNLLKPDFVVITGDIVFGQLNPLEYVYEYEEIYRVLKEFKVPVYIVPGNHDCYAQDAMITDGQLYWTNYFGPRYFSFNYGPYAHFTGADSFDWDKSDRAGAELLVKTWGGQIREAQMSWIRSDLETNSYNRMPVFTGMTNS